MLIMAYLKAHTIYNEKYFTARLFPFFSYLSTLYSDFYYQMHSFNYSRNMAVCPIVVSGSESSVLSVKLSSSHEFLTFSSKTNHYYPKTTILLSILFSTIDTS